MTNGVYTKSPDLASSCSASCLAAGTLVKIGVVQVRTIYFFISMDRLINSQGGSQLACVAAELGECGPQPRTVAEADVWLSACR